MPSYREAVSNIERGPDRCRSRRRRHQAADRAQGRREVWRFPRPDPSEAGERAFFVHGFAKSDRDNIWDDELAALKRLAAELVNCDDAALARAVAAGVLTEVMQ